MTPSFDDFFAAVRPKLGADVSDDQIRSAYQSRFGGDAVLTRGPTLEQFSSTVRARLPEASDDEIRSAYDSRYGAGFFTSAKRGLKSALAEGQKFIGGMVEGGRTWDPATGLGGLGAAGYLGYRRLLAGEGKGLGRSIFEYGKGVQEANAPAVALQENVVDRPGLLAKPAFWGQAAGGLGSLALQPWSLATGGVQRGAEISSDLEAQGDPLAEVKGLGAGAAITGLNFIPGMRIAGGVPGRLANAALMGGASAAAPVVEAAARGTDIGQGLKEGLTAAPAGALFGALAVPGREGRATSGQQQRLSSALEQAADVPRETPAEAHQATAYEPGSHMPLDHPDIDPRMSPATRVALSAAFDNAHSVKPWFDEGLAAAADELGGTYKAADIKGVLRTTQKAMNDYGGDISRLKDLVRGTIAFEDLGAVQDAIPRLVERFGAEAALVKNTLHDGVRTIDGYRDAKIYVPLPSGGVGELQIHFKAMEDAKQIAHPLYEERRILSGKADITAEELARIDELNAQMREIYEPAWEAAKAALAAKGNRAAQAPAESFSPASSTLESMNGRIEPSSETARTAAPPPSAGETTTGSPSTAQSPNTSDIPTSTPSIPRPEVMGAEPNIRPEIQGIPLGQDHEVSTLRGTTANVRPIVVEAADLLTSDLAGYPKELQPRDRSRAASDQQTLEIARSMGERPQRFGAAPGADDGAPIVTRGGEVVSGNGRIMAARRMYETMPEGAAKYRAWLEQQGADIRGMRQPVLVRTLQSDLDLPKFAREANERRTMDSSPTERANNDAEALDSGLLSGMRSIDFASAGNAEFVRSFISRIGANERAGMLDASGKISAEGIRRIQGAVLARAYGGDGIANLTLARMLESPHNEVRSITNGLLAAAPEMAALRARIDEGKVPKDWNLAPQLAAATETLARIKSLNQSIQDYLIQGDAFMGAEEYGLKSAISMLTDGERILGAEKIAQILRYYARAGETSDSTQASLLGGSVKPGEAMKAARESVAERQATQNRLLEPSDYVSGGRGYKGKKIHTDQMEFDFSSVPTREKASAKAMDESIAAVRDLVAFRDRGKVNVVAAAITKDFERRGFTSLEGKIINYPHDLAVLSQVYRDPRYETLRVFYIKRKKIILQTGLTSRLAGAVNFGPLAVDQIKARAMALGADSYYMMHNHPSGNPEPSRPDLMTHARFEDDPRYKGHIILNHTHYSLIEKGQPWALSNPVPKDYRGYDPRTNPSVPHAELEKPIDLENEFDKAVTRLASMANPSGKTTLVATDGNGRIKAIVQYENELLSADGTHKYKHRAFPLGQDISTNVTYTDVPSPGPIARVERLKRMSGGSLVFAVGPDPRVTGMLVARGVIQNHVTPSGALSRPWAYVDNHFEKVRVPMYGSVAELTTVYGDGNKVEIGGGEYSWQQHGRLSKREFEVMQGVMLNLDEPVAQQRGGREPQTWSDTEKQAMKLVSDKLGITLENLVARKPGSTANAAQLEAYGMLLNTATRNVAALAAKAAQTGANADVLALAAAREKLGLLMAPAMGYKTEAGRALNILRKMAGEFRMADKIFAELGDGSRDALLDFAKRAQEASPDQLLALTRESYRPTWWDKGYEYWINAILSGPKTHAVNISSNALYQALETTAEAVASLTSRHVSTREVAARVSAITHGGMIGLKNAKNALLSAESEIGGSQLEHRKAIAGLKGEIIRTPSRFLMAEDEFFKSVEYHAELAQLAMREAIATGKPDIRAEFDRIMGGISDRKDLIAKARDRARRLTFQDPLGPVMSVVALGLTKSKVGRLIVPFIRTPTNILKRAIEFTPGAFALKEVRNALSAGGRDAALARSRMMIGSSVMLGAVGMAAKGMISGAGPADDNEKRILMQTGWRPYSIKSGDQWVQYSRFDPMGSLLGIAADMYELGHYVQAGEADKIGSMILTSIALNVTNKTFLKGITDYSQAMADPGRYFANWAQGMASSVIPNAVGQLAREMDPYSRQARTLLDSIKEKIPGLRETLARRVDLGGNPIESTGTGYGSPLSVSQEKSVPLADAMLRVGLYKSPTGRSVSVRSGGKAIQADLGDAEYESLATFVGQARSRVLTPMVQSPQFRALMQSNPEMARSLLEKQWDKITSDARQAWIYRNPGALMKSAKSGPRHIGSSYVQARQ